jgi:hypothetical protein
MTGETEGTMKGADDGKSEGGEEEVRPTGVEGLPKGAWRISADARETTLGDHGNQLLVGAVPNGFTTAPVDIAFRAHVGRHVDRNASLNNRGGLRFLYYIAHALERLGTEDFTTMAIGERVVNVGRMRVTDAAYMTYCRMAELRDGMFRQPIGRARCEACMGLLPTTVDVNIHTLAVRVYDEPVTAWYRFRDDWFWRGKLVETVELSPPTLTHAVEPLNDEELDDPFLRGCSWIAAAIDKVNGEKAHVQMDEILSRDKKTGHAMLDDDFRSLDDLVTNIIQGAMADAVIWKHDVPSCGAPVAVPVSWAAAFFGRGAGSARGSTWT